jgi:hypothetical protein
MSLFERLAAVLRIVPQLGLYNLLRVAYYRVKIALGWRPIGPADPLPPGNLFSNPKMTGIHLGAVEVLLFGWLKIHLEGVPNWHANPLNSSEQIDSNLDWPDALNALKGRDVKPFWELSRFDWLPQWALAARHGDTAALERLNTWVANWLQQNQPYRGINWACGQESAIRVMNLAISQIILGGTATPSPTLAWLVETSARRIRPTLSYALGQDNNHGSAEACALFIAGTWGQLWKMPNASEMAKIGRHWLQNRAMRLIHSDGSPCQYSTNYHRANLETFCIAELWRRYVNTEPFPKDITERIVAGTRWLNHMVDPQSGDTPNFGANDGSHLFNCSSSPYRDFRSTVSLSARLFDSATVSAYSHTNFLDKRINLFNLPPATQSWGDLGCQSYDDGGFHVIRFATVSAVMRYPRFYFRPSHADALHLDLWLGGDNLLRDAGSYSYSIEGQWLSYFGGTASHNTVQFDERDQMPRLGRFLFGDWLKAEGVQTAKGDAQCSQFAAGYRDRQGVRHHRLVTLQPGKLLVVDSVQGFACKAVLRWRLQPGDWIMEPSAECPRLVLGPERAVTLCVTASVPVFRSELVQGWESRHYLEKTSVPVLEVEVQQACTITTEVHWAL